MIDKIGSIENKIENLEEEISKANLKNQEENDNTNCVEFTLSPLSINVLSSNKFLISKIPFEKNKSYCFQNQIDLTLYSDQVVNLRILIDGISIYKTTKNLKSGFNQITMIKSYQPLATFDGEVEIYVEACEGEMLMISSNTLLVWGLLQDVLQKNEYRAIETNSNYIISFIENNQVYEKTISKQINYFSKEDFTLKTTALSYDYAYFSSSDTIYYFRLDKNGNLFYSTNKNTNEIYICSNVDCISVSSSSEKILVSYVKDNNCFYFEIENNMISLHKKISLNKKILKTYSYYNQNLSKFFIIATDSNESNYLFETATESSNNSENISATYQITVEEEE